MENTVVCAQVQYCRFLTQGGPTEAVLGWAGTGSGLFTNSKKTHSDRQPNIRHRGWSFNRQETSFRVNLQIWGIVKY